MDTALLVALGVAVGVLMGLTGSSGVALTVPALSYMGLTYQQSVGASLLVDLVASLSTLAVYLNAHDVDGRYAAMLGLGALAGAQLGSHVAVRAPEPPLEILFAASSFYFAYTSLGNAVSGSDKGLLPQIRSRIGELRPRARRMAAVLSSVGIGLITGLIGASGGIMFAVVISAISDMPIRKVVGTATAAMALSALGGATAYFYLGQLNIWVALVVGSSALVSGFAAARLAHKIHPRLVYLALSALFTIVAILELLRALSVLI